MKIRNVCIVLLALIFSCQSKMNENEGKSQLSFLSYQIEEFYEVIYQRKERLQLSQSKSFPEKKSKIQLKDPYNKVAL